LEQNSSLFSQGFTVSTRDGQEYDFSMFLSFYDAFRHISQLTNFAMRQLIEEEGFAEDPALRVKHDKEGGKKVHKKRRKITFFQRDLDAKQRTDEYRYLIINYGNLTTFYTSAVLDAVFVCLTRKNWTVTHNAVWSPLTREKTIRGISFFPKISSVSHQRFVLSSVFYIFTALKLTFFLGRSLCQHNIVAQGF
jgi:hypothetical protein